MHWKNRISGYGEADPEKLLANERNWRLHPKFQQETLESALDEIGWIQDVIINKRSSPEWGQLQNVETLIDGHLRLELAKRKGEKRVPVKYVDLDPHQEALALATFDPVAALAGSDVDMLQTLLDEISIEDEQLMKFFKHVSEKEGLLPKDLDFPEYDESVADGVQLCVCEKCGHEHSSKKNA